MPYPVLMFPFSVNQIITQLTSNVAGPIATLSESFTYSFYLVFTNVICADALTPSTYSSAVVIEQSNKIKTATSSAVSQITALQGSGDLALLFGLVGWLNTLIGVSGVSLVCVA